MLTLCPSGRPRPVYCSSLNVLAVHPAGLPAEPATTDEQQSTLGNAEASAVASCMLWNAAGMVPA